MEKTLQIVNLVLRIAALVILSLTTLLAIFMAYIMFAPDDMPKPFRLVYEYPVSNPSVAFVPGSQLNCQPVSADGKSLTGADEAVATEIKPGEGKMVNMSTKIINLSDPSGRKYIRTTVVLEFQPPAEVLEEAAAGTGSGEGGEGATTVTAAAAFEAEINTRMPLMDDIVITTLSQKTYEQLYTAQGKEALRTEIMEAINTALPEFHIIAVYFTEFVVQ